MCGTVSSDSVMKLATTHWSVTFARTSPANREAARPIAAIVRSKMIAAIRRGARGFSILNAAGKW